MRKVRCPRASKTPERKIHTLTLFRITFLFAPITKALFRMMAFRNPILDLFSFA
jgi:hypothetical protein